MKTERKYWRAETKTKKINVVSAVGREQKLNGEVITFYSFPSYNIMNRYYTLYEDVAISIDINSVFMTIRTDVVPIFIIHSRFCFFSCRVHNASRR